MARIRTIKPEFWTSEQIVECAPLARFLFVGMWNFADDNGALVASTKRIKMQVFPADDFTADMISDWVEDLVGNGLLSRYHAQGKDYWQITGWHHQKIDRPSKNCHPRPEKEHPDGPKGNGSGGVDANDIDEIRRAFDEHSTSPRDGVHSTEYIVQSTDIPIATCTDVNNQCRSTQTEPKDPPQAATQPESNPSDKNSSRGARLPDDWTLPEDWRQLAESSRPHADIDEEAMKFANYWQAKTGRDACKRDWRKTWHNWILKISKVNGNGQHQQRRPNAQERMQASGERLLAQVRAEHRDNDTVVKPDFWRATG